MFDLESYLTTRRTLVDDALAQALPGDDVHPTTIHRATAGTLRMTSAIVDAARYAGMTTAMSELSAPDRTGGSYLVGLGDTGFGEGVAGAGEAG